MNEFGTDACAGADGDLLPIVEEDVVTITPVMLQPTQRGGADHTHLPSLISLVFIS